MLWCGLPSGGRARWSRPRERHGLRLAAGPLFGTGHALDDRLRLPFTQPPEVLERAVALLARARRRGSPAGRAAGRATAARSQSVV